MDWEQNVDGIGASMMEPSTEHNLLDIQSDNLQVEEVKLCTSHSACDDTGMTAITYCSICEDYLCSNCNLYHSKARRTKEHSVTQVLQSNNLSPVTSLLA